MPIVKSVKNALRNAFSYAVHQESAGDHDRKLAVVENIIAASSPAATESGTEYEAALRATLMQSRTKYLDVIADRKIAVTLDSRLGAQKIEHEEIPVAGVFYPDAKGGLVTLPAGEKDSYQNRQNGILLEKLVLMLAEATPAAPVYAYAWSDMAFIPGGGGAVVNINGWGLEGNDQSTAVKNNPALKNPPAKPKAVAPN